MTQHEAAEEHQGERGQLVIMTHTAPTGNFRAAVAQMDRLSCVAAPIFGPLTGYQTYLANKYGGYFPFGDAKDTPSYLATIVAPFFYLWIPLEIRNDGWGSLANTATA